ncbi:MAG: hypothetical protein O3A63_19620 [Proteobacteria bacterium]|nr:hypothetical protein [Pseudomonadota bacterium]
MNLNWDAVGAIAELVSGIGVIATLMYLALQIRQNTKSVRETNLRSQTDRAIGHSRFVVSTPEMMNIFRRGCANLDELTPDERWKVGTFLFSMVQGWQEEFHLQPFPI